MKDLKTVLGDLLTDQIKEKLGDHQIFVFEKGEDPKLDAKEFIPKARFNEIAEQAKQSKTQLDELTAKLKELEKAAEGSEELKKQIADLNTQNEKIRTESEAQLAEYRKKESVKRALIKDGAKDEELLISKIDLSVVKLDGEKLLGYSDQVEALKKSHSWGFGEVKVDGLPPKKETTDTGEKNPFSKDHFNLTEQMRLLREDPAKAEQLKKSAT